MSQQATTSNIGSLVGQTLDRRYLVERLLDRGSMGEVYLARNLRTDGKFAVKVLLREVAFDDDLYNRFRNEARLSTVLRHPCIVQVFDFSQLPDGRPFLVMEYLQGEDLHTHLRRVGRMPLAEVLQISRQLGSALHAAHGKGVVHRDLKPGNIILLGAQQDDPSSLLVKVIDFGLSRIRGLLDNGAVTLDSHILGTPQYMSPEAAQGLNSMLDGRSDQFSLAVIVYLLLSGQQPFAGKDLIETLHKVVYVDPPPLGKLVPDLPPHVAAAVTRALAKCKVERFATTLDFVRALDGLPPLPAEEPTFFGQHDTVVDVPSFEGLPEGAFQTIVDVPTGPVARDGTGGTVLPLGGWRGA